jgi:hypothetical protein
MREVVTSTDILLANSNHPYFLIMGWSNKIALLRIPTECILTKRLESNSNLRYKSGRLLVKNVYINEYLLQVQPDVLGDSK